MGYPPPDGADVKIHLDADKCQGHGRCYSLAPELFDCDDLGQAVVVVTGELDESQLAKANLAAKRGVEEL